MIEVWYDHEVIGTHPAGSTHEPNEAGDLVVREPGAGEPHVYRAGSWHAAGRGLVCAFLAPRDDCPRCHP